MNKIKRIICLLSMITAVNISNAEEINAISLSKDDIQGGIYKNSIFKYLNPLGNDVRGSKVFNSIDKEFSLGGMELVMDENTHKEHKYTNFNRNELMLFTQGGMRLIDNDGYEVEAKKGEIIFIPKGWNGTRIFTGQSLMQKFSVVHYQRGSNAVINEAKAMSWSNNDLISGIYRGVPLKWMSSLNTQGRSVKLYKSADEAFSIGGFELVFGDQFVSKKLYVNFPHDELMFFTKGGIKLINPNGSVVIANEGEMAFIPKGWSGTRIFTGETGIQKFSMVYKANTDKGEVKKLNL